MPRTRPAAVERSWQLFIDIDLTGQKDTSGVLREHDTNNMTFDTLKAVKVLWEGSRI